MGLKTIIYQPGTDDDCLLIEWYAVLRSTGDLQTTFFQDMHSLSGFLAGFRGATLVLAVSEGRVWGAAWVEQINRAAFIGVWIHEAARRTYQAAHFFSLAHEQFATAFPYLYVLTTQEAVVALILRFGYTNHGLIPGLWEGYPAYLLSLDTATTKENPYYGQRQRRGRHPRHPETNGRVEVS